ncbi:MAG TPA: hypothetical protein VKT73_16140 [Xanthobacteraceae bacterium]|nr:hypothetical protein [Xanthobacteraceae bacterium]
MNWSRSKGFAAQATSLAVLTWLTASPAVAQMYPPPAPYPAPAYGVGPSQVLARVQSMGLHPVSEPFLRGPVWVVRAVGREGTLVRVLVDAGTGRVVNMVAIERPYPSRLAYGGPANEGPWVPMPGPGYGPPPPGGGYPPSGPYVVPGPQSPQGSAIDPRMGTPPEYRQGVNGTPPEKKVASRPVTPLPKPRPSDAPQDESKKDTPAVAAAPKEPEITGSVPASVKPSEKKDDTSGAAARTPDNIPVSPLE